MSDPTAPGPSDAERRLRQLEVTVEALAGELAALRHELRHELRDELRAARGARVAGAGTAGAAPGGSAREAVASPLATDAFMAGGNPGVKPPVPPAGPGSARPSVSAR